jgi:ubiquinone/menaquinone biosynthesis C-methylase UbiE
MMPDPKELSPRPLMRILGDFANSQILDASIEYDFFSLIDKGLQTAQEIASAAGTDLRATRIVLDSLPALSLVEKRAEKYFLTPEAKAFLVRGKPSYVGDFRHVALALWEGMAHLKETLKTGKPLSRMDTVTELEVWEKLVLGIIVIAEPAAKALCDELKIGTQRKGLKVLDIAGGSSIFGMTILSRDPSSQITQLDWPNVNAVARKLNKERGFEGRIRFIDGEHNSTAIEVAHYDLVVASNFCRFESPKGNQALFVKAYNALKPGGIFAVNDFVPNEERTKPTFALRFSVYTLTHTPEGECWTLAQYSGWLSKAGFKSIETRGDIPKTLPGTMLIIASKERKSSVRGFN